MALSLLFLSSISEEVLTILGNINPAQNPTRDEINHMLREFDIEIAGRTIPYTTENILTRILLRFPKKVFTIPLETNIDMDIDAANIPISGAENLK